jgi:hypothetical protein
MISGCNQMEIFALPCVGKLKGYAGLIKCFMNGFRGFVRRSVRFGRRGDIYPDGRHS